MLQEHKGIPVYSSRLRSALDKANITGIQYLPVRVIHYNRTEIKGYAIANIFNLVPAIDFERSVRSKHGRRMVPLLPLSPAEQPWHSGQYQSLPEVFAQNASLEIAWSRVALEGRTIAGTVIMPFFTQGYEGFDVNKPYDWQLAEELVKSGKANLPFIEKPPFPDVG